MKNGYFGGLIFQEIELFERLKYNFKTWNGYRVSAAKIYLDHSSKIAKARSHSAEWPTSVQSNGQCIDIPLHHEIHQNTVCTLHL